MRAVAWFDYNQRGTRTRAAHEYNNAYTQVFTLAKGAHCENPTGHTTALFHRFTTALAKSRATTDRQFENPQIAASPI